VKTLSALAAVALAVIIGLGWYTQRIPASPFDGAAPSHAAMPVEKGEYVARLADCVACHSVPEGAPFAGGLEMGTPLGSIFATNITPDKDTGIGNYTLAQFDNAVRRGVAADGRRLYPAMPYPSYAKMSDEDVEALYDYFMNHVRPVRQWNRDSDIAWPMNMRWPLALWNLAFTEGDTYQTAEGHDEAWNRGAYLVQGPGHCGSCHTPRGLAMQERALTEQGNAYLAGALIDGWYAPSLRNDHDIGLGRWSEEEIVAFLKTGRNRHGVVFGSMMEAFNNSTQFMTDADLGAIAHYLKSLPGRAPAGATQWAYDAGTAKMLAAGTGNAPAGAQLYVSRCGYCHGQDGKGRGDLLPGLAGATSLLAPDPSSAINIVLNGAGRVVAGGVADAYRMPSLRAHLDDRQVAEILTFARSAWGNKATAVTPEQVGALRGRTDPASTDVIVLQMR
jgi:mono/diheme cytochrome c family protein